MTLPHAASGGGGHEGLTVASLRSKEALLAQWEDRLRQREVALQLRDQAATAAATAGTSLVPHSPRVPHAGQAELKQRTPVEAATARYAATQLETLSDDPGSPSKEHVPPLAVYLRSGKFLRSAVFGGLDGLTTSIVLICSTSGLVHSHAALPVSAPDAEGPATAAMHDASRGHISAAVMFTLGAANLVADAFSMGMGDFLSSLAEAEHEGGDVGLHRLMPWWKQPAFVEASRNGLAMFVSFVVFGVLPLAAYAPALPASWVTDHRRFVVACVLGLVSLFVLGMLKGYLSATSSMSTSMKRRAVLASAVKMMLTGGIASVISFVVSLELHTDPA